MYLKNTKRVPFIARKNQNFVTVGNWLNIDLERVSSPFDNLLRYVKHMNRCYVLSSGRSSMKFVRSLLSLIPHNIYIFILKFKMFLWKTFTHEEKTLATGAMSLYRHINTFKVVTVQWNLVNSFISAIDRIFLGCILKFRIVFEQIGARMLPCVITASISAEFVDSNSTSLVDFPGFK